MRMRQKWAMPLADSNSADAPQMAGEPCLPRAPNTRPTRDAFAAAATARLLNRCNCRVSYFSASVASNTDHI